MKKWLRKLYRKLNPFLGSIYSDAVWQRLSDHCRREWLAEMRKLRTDMNTAPSSQIQCMRERYFFVLAVYTYHYDIPNFDTPCHYV